MQLGKYLPFPLHFVDIQTGYKTYKALLEQFELPKQALVMLYQPPKVNAVTACAQLNLPFVIKLKNGMHQDTLMWMKQVLLFNCSDETLLRFLNTLKNKFPPLASTSTPTKTVRAGKCRSVERKSPKAGSKGTGKPKEKGTKKKSEKEKARKKKDTRKVKQSGKPKKKSKGSVEASSSEDDSDWEQSVHEEEEEEEEGEEEEEEEEEEEREETQAGK